MPLGPLPLTWFARACKEAFVLHLDTEPQERALHLVHFYDSTDDLATAAAEYLTPGLVSGDAVIVVARPSHAAAITEAVRRSVPSPRFFAELDAATTLGELLVDGKFDMGTFDSVVGALTRQAAESHGRVRVYGEMVDLLWEQGNVAGALELERMWNTLGEVVPLSLLCAYSSTLTAEPGLATAVATVCDLHCEIVSTGPSLERAEAARWFPNGAHIPRHARLFVAETLSSWGREELVDDAVLVTTELVTNAIMHARSPFTVSIRRNDGSVTIGVGDRAPVPVSHQVPEPSDVSGRGLLLVDALSDSWGQSVEADGKLVWADLTSR